MRLTWNFTRRSARDEMIFTFCFSNLLATFFFKFRSFVCSHLYVGIQVVHIISRLVHSCYAIVSLVPVLITAWVLSR